VRAEPGQLKHSPNSSRFHKLPSLATTDLLMPRRSRTVDLTSLESSTQILRIEGLLNAPKRNVLNFSPLAGAVQAQAGGPLFLIRIK
jgi:hypothetical protein